jgi:hypothetical protein
MFAPIHKLFRKSNNRRSTKVLARSRRARLQVEGLEDRLVMTSASLLGSSLLVNASQVSSIVSQTQPIVRTGSLPTTTTASQNGSTLTIIAAPGQITYLQSDGAGHIDVNAIGERAQFNISSINTVNITGLGNQGDTSNVQIDDSKGMPFAPGTTISLSGSGTAPTNVLTLDGSLTLSGNETYVPGSIVHLSSPGGLSIFINTPATLSLNNLNLKFVLNSSFGGEITDNLPITGTLDVQTSGTQVQLNSYGPGGDQYFSGLGNGAGSGLAYSGKPSVTLDTFAPNASIFLDAPDAAVGESYFTVNMHAASETTTLDQTPKNVVTVVNVDPPATNARVALWGNFGPVIIDGDSTTGVNIGYPLNSTGPITSGIEANVTVEGGEFLVVNDGGNVSTFEQVRVTEQTISGSGLFGSSNVTLEYGGINEINIVTGQLANGYTVAPSSPNAVFNSILNIDSNSYMAFHVNVSVNSASHLNLTLFNGKPQQDHAVLDVTSTGGSLDFSNTFPNGTVDAFFAGQATSQIFYNGFENVF